MKAFVDNNLSSKLAAGMKGFGEDVVHLKEIFPDDTPDADWLPYVGQNDMILVTRDNKIRWNPSEIAAFKAHNVGAFFLSGKKRTACELIQQLVRNYPRMKELAGKTRRPFMFRVPPNGTKIEQLQP
ncbi:DUF5615 family PIN-like protein [bacterium]|nr:DUF5615 family PIN-like protein [bacterium]